VRGTCRVSDEDIETIRECYEIVGNAMPGLYRCRRFVVQ